jgi:hypothetical protein
MRAQPRAGGSTATEFGELERGDKRFRIATFRNKAGE